MLAVERQDDADAPSGGYEPSYAGECNSEPSSLDWKPSSIIGTRAKGVYTSPFALATISAEREEEMRNSVSEQRGVQEAADRYECHARTS